MRSRRAATPVEAQPGSFAIRLPGTDLAGFTTLDILVHGWDLAKATGQQTALAAPWRTVDLLLTMHQCLGEPTLVCGPP